MSPNPPVKIACLVIGFGLAASLFPFLTMPPAFAAKCDIPHSSIILMSAGDNTDVIHAYDADWIAWGGQVPWPSIETIKKQRNRIARAHYAGVKCHSVGLGLIQEGTRYLAKTVGRWDLHDLNTDRLSTGMLAKIAEHAVLGIHGNVVGAPWVKGRLAPMACVHDPGYRKWLEKRVDALMLTLPDALHIDEPLAGGEGVNASPPGCFCDRCCAAFREYLRKQPEVLWRQNAISSLDGFNYREFLRANGGWSHNAPLWKEFREFQALSAGELVKEVRERALLKARKPLFFSANASPVRMLTRHSLPLLDYSSVEIPHRAKRRRVADDPILVYKAGTGMGLPVFSTALGGDWKEIVREPRPQLVGAWIAQAYAFGQWMMMPHNAWVPGGRYLPPPDLYGGLAKWIKRNSFLFDGFEEVSDTVVVVPLAAMNKEENKQALTKLCGLLCRRNIQYHLFFWDGAKSSRTFGQNAKQTVIVFPKLFSKDELVQIRSTSGNVRVANLTEKSVEQVLLRGFVSPVNIDNASGVFALPRRSEKQLVIHLLNRDYDPQKRVMEDKGPMDVWVSQALIPGGEIKRVLLRQSPVPGADGINEGETTVLKFHRRANGYQISVPSLMLWGIIEFEGNDQIADV